jgi:hypothetical protein
MGDNIRGTGTKVVHSNKTHKRQTKGTKDNRTKTIVAHSNRRTRDKRTKRERQKKREQGKCS